MFNRLVILFALIALVLLPLLELSQLVTSALTLIMINSVLLSLAGGWSTPEKKITFAEIAATKNDARNNLAKAFHYDDALLTEFFPSILCIKDAKGRWLQAKDVYLRCFNIQNIDYQGKTNYQLAQYPGTNIADLNASAVMDNRALNSLQLEQETRTMPLLEGSEATYTIQRILLKDNAKQSARLIITGQTLETSEIENDDHELMSAVFQGCHLSYVLLNKKLNIVRINTAFTLLTGYLRGQTAGMPISGIVQENEDWSVLIEDYFTKQSDNAIWKKEFVCKRKNGDSFNARLEMLKLHLQQNKVSYFALLHDVSKQKRDEKRILQIAHYDDLTGLANRVMFFERLAQFLSASKRHRLNAVIFFIDLDRFKTVNDSLGHDAGDELLKETAKRLQSLVRIEDVVARLSGDEFAVLLLNEKSHEQAIYSSSMVAEKIIQALSNMYFIKRREVFISASIGISIFPEDGKAAEVLLKNADTAMYEAKRLGRNNYQFYKKAFTAASQDRLMMENDLRKALERKELCLYFQPQYGALNRKIWGAEVLLRWQKNVNGKSVMIPPNNFIPIAEDSGLIIDMGKWILEQACIQLKAWKDKNYPLPQLSINISPRQFLDPDFIQVLEDALVKAQLAPEFIELEITESMLIGDTKRIELLLNRLKKMGFKIALDDFGTGYSSLSYLKNFPIDILKIDQSFIREMTPGSKDARLAGSIIDMGHSLGQKVVAEGVENQLQLEYLSQCHCDIIQGYYFSPALPEMKMRDLLQMEFANTKYQK